MPVELERVVVSLAAEIIELDALLAGPIMGIAADHDDATLGRRNNLIQQQVNQQEVPEMVDHELLLEAVNLLEFLQGHDGRIADQHIDGWRDLAYAQCTVNDGVEV